MIAVLKMLSKLLEHDNKRWGLIFGCFLFSSIIDLLSLSTLIPVLSVALFGEVSLGNHKSSILIDLFDVFASFSIIELAFLLLVLFLLKSIAILTTQYLIVSFVNQQRVKLGTRMFASYLDIGASTINKKREADQIYNLQTLTSHYTTAVQASLKFSNDALIGAAIVFFLFLVDWVSLIIIVCTLSFFLFAYLVFFRRMVIRYGRNANDYSADAIRISNEGIRGINEIHFLEKTDYFLDNYVSALHGIKSASVKIEIHSIIPRILIEMSIIAILVFALLFVAANQVSLEGLALTFGIYAVSVLRLIPIFSSLTTQITKFRAVQNSIERLYNDVFMKQTDKNEKSKENKTLPAAEAFHSIIFENVCFHYDKEKPIIRDFCFSIEKGDIIGVCGPSGSGKSTLIKLVLGLLSPTNGKILLNGKLSGEGIQTEKLGFAYIPPNAIMLNRSLIENIVFAVQSSKEDYKNISNILKQTYLDDVLESLPHGLDEPLGDYGTRFSTGQKQRLAFARAIAHGKRFFVLDESTNAIDIDTEKALLNDLIKTGIIETALIVSHRPSTLEVCDHILDFKEENIDIIEGAGRLNFKVIKGRYGPEKH